MNTDEQIDAGLDDEFERYLGAVAREMIQPIREVATQRKAEVDRLCTSVAEAHNQMAEMFDSHHREFLAEQKGLVDSLKSTENNIEDIVVSLREVNREIGEQLLAQVSALPSAVQSDIGVAGQHLEKTVEARLMTAEANFAVAVKRSIRSKLDSVAERKSLLTRIQVLLLVICGLQAAMIVVVLLR